LKHSIIISVFGKVEATDITISSIQLLDIASVTMAPDLRGFTRHWASDFQENSGSMPDDNRWDVVKRGPNHGNKEVQNFVKDTSVVCQDGDQLIICPSECSTWPVEHMTLNLRSCIAQNIADVFPFTRAAYDGKKWTSARLHCKKDFHASENRIMIIQAQLKVSSSAEILLSGVWPSFWLLGKSYREGGDASWPDCGEIDIFENAAGKPFSIPALHFGRMLGGKGHKADFDRGRFQIFTGLLRLHQDSVTSALHLAMLLVEGRRYSSI